MTGLSDVIGLGILLRWQDKASAKIEKTERAVNSLGKSADEADRKAGKLQATFAKLGKAGAMITVLGLAGAGAMFGITRAAGTFQDTLRDTMTMTGLTGQAFEQMEQDLGALSLSMSTRFGMAASEINKSFYQVLSSGAQAGTEQFRALSDSALMLAKVVGMDPTVAVESLSDTLHSFEMDVRDAEKMADVFFKTSMLGATTVPQMAEAMTEASKVAVELKMPLADVAAVLTGFASKGIKGVQAGTAFRMVMGRLAAPVGAAQKALAALGVQVYDTGTKEMRPVINILEDLKKGLAGVSHQEREMLLKAVAGEEVFAKLGGLLAGDISLLKGWSKELETGGVLQVAFAQKAATLNFTAAALRESLRNLAIVLGQHLLPMITPIIGKMAMFVRKLVDLSRAHPGIAKAAVMFGAMATAVALVVGPLLTVAGIIGAMGGIPAMLGMVSAGFASLGAVAGVMGTMISAAFWPITAIVAVVALLYAAFKTNFLGISDMAIGVGKVLGSFFKGMWTGAKTVLAPLGQTFKEVWAALQAAMAPLAEAGREIGRLLGITSQGSLNLDKFTSAAQLLGKVIGMSLVLPIKVLLTGIVYLLKGFTWLLQGANKLGQGLGSVFASVQQAVTGSFIYIKDMIFNVLDMVWAKLSWLLAHIPNVFLPQSLERIKNLNLVQNRSPILGQASMPAPAYQTAAPSPAAYPGPEMLPAFHAAAAGPMDQSINISPGAIVFHATKVDESVAMQIDRELARLIERRRERQ